MAKKKSAEKKQEDTISQILSELSKESHNTQTIQEATEERLRSDREQKLNLFNLREFSRGFFILTCRSFFNAKTVKIFPEHKKLLSAGKEFFIF